jgi:hypothetical protein
MPLSIIESGYSLITSTLNFRRNSTRTFTSPDTLRDTDYFVIWRRQIGALHGVAIVHNHDLAVPGQDVGGLPIGRMEAEGHIARWDRRVVANNRRIPWTVARLPSDELL